jgi:hypothetical protein
VEDNSQLGSARHDRRRDSVIDPAFMANRAHARITEVKAGQLSMISQPDAVTKVILEAAQSVAG